jgi:hypothetical protein
MSREFLSWFQEQWFIDANSMVYTGCAILLHVTGCGPLDVHHILSSNMYLDDGVDKRLMHSRAQFKASWQELKQGSGLRDVPSPYHLKDDDGGRHHQFH